MVDKNWRELVPDSSGNLVEAPRPSMKQDDHPEHSMPDSQHKGTIMPPESGMSAFSRAIGMKSNTVKVPDGWR